MTTNTRDNIVIIIEIIVLLGLTKVCSLLVGETAIALLLAVVLNVILLIIIVLIIDSSKNK